MYFTKTKQRIRIALPAVLALALAAAPAHASSSSTSAYDGQGAVLDQTIKTTHNVSNPAPVTAAKPVSGSRLPFTGFDVTLLVFGGIVLVAIGFAMRRLARPRLR